MRLLTFVRIHTLTSFVALALATSPASAQGVDECSAPQPGWLFCDDFERDRLGQYFEYVSDSGSFVRARGVGRDSSFGMRARFGFGQVEAGRLHIAIGKTPQRYMRPVDAGTAKYRDIYWRVYLRLQPGWIGGGGDKFSRATVFASPTTWAQAMVAHVWSGKSDSPEGSFLMVDPVRATDDTGTVRTTRYNDFTNFFWLGNSRERRGVFGGDYIGQWICIETRVRLNDAGRANGMMNLWINDRLEAQRLGLNFLGNYSEYGINAVFLENYWNTGSPAAQERYFDNYVVSTQRIGCIKP